MLSLALAILTLVPSAGSPPAVRNPGFESAPARTGREVKPRLRQEHGRAPTVTADRSDATEGAQSLLMEAEDVHIFAEHTTKRPIDAKQQGQFIELLCNLSPSITAQQVVSTSFEDAPPCRVA
ncbi:MAG: hypothetical protein ABSF45_11900, partial [Terriglobia bacterium]